MEEGMRKNDITRAGDKIYCVYESEDGQREIYFFKFYSLANNTWEKCPNPNNNSFQGCHSASLVTVKD